MKTIYKMSILFLACFFLPACAYLHHIQLGDIDNRSSFERIPVSVKVSENGINLNEASNLLKHTGSKAQEARKGLFLLSLFQMGPVTGNPVYNDEYADNILDLLRSQCKGGRLTALNSIREMQKYPVISGEIVKLTAYCLRKKGK